MNTLLSNLTYLAVVSLLFVFANVSCQEKDSVNNETTQKQTQDLAGKTDLLTVGDMEKVTGLTGVKLVPRNPKIGAGGDLNFATADDNLLVMLVVADMDIFNQWKNGKNYVAKRLNNIGDEAYSAPGGGIQYIVFFRSGDNVASVSSFQNVETGKALLTIDQLSELAKIVVSRM